jgi:NADH:ubiquinone reductase (H+-translocating)
MLHSSPLLNTEIVTKRIAMEGDKQMRTSEQTTNIVVIGGGYGGVMAALRLAGKTRKSQVQITLVNGSASFSERIRLHQVAAGQSPRPLDLHKLLDGSGVDFYQGWVTALQPEQKRLSVESASGLQTLSYDYLIYAAGSTVERAMIPGGRAHALALSDQAGAVEARARLAAVGERGGEVLVIGGGLTGIELASEVAEAYPRLRVTLATSGQLGAGLSRRGAAYVRRVLEEMGITLREETQITQVEAAQARTRTGGSIAFDVCIWAGAFRASPLAEHAGLPTNRAGQVLVDRYLRCAAYPQIYVVGDAAATPLRMACATALPMGAYAADHLAARIHQRPAPSPFRFSYVLQCISLGRGQGLVQFVQPDDRPREQVLTGRLAAFVKESICRYTIWSLQGEKRWPGSYSWPQASSASAEERLTGLSEQHP